MANPSRLGLPLAYGAICVIWGTTYLAIKIGLDSFDPIFYAGVRYTLGAALSLLLARSQGVSFGGPLRRWWPAFGVGVLFIAVSNGLVFWAETRLDSGFTALLMTTSPLWTALLAPLLGGDRGPRIGGWLGIALGFGGTVLLIQPWRAGAVQLAAALAVEISVVSWAVGSHWVRHIRQDFHPMALTVAQMGAGALVLLAVAAVRGRALVGPVTIRSLLALGVPRGVRLVRRVRGVHLPAAPLERDAGGDLHLRQPGGRADPRRAGAPRGRDRGHGRRGRGGVRGGGARAPRAEHGRSLIDFALRGRFS